MSQIFKEKISRDIIEELFETYLGKEDNKYVFNKYIFKKMVLNENLEDFCSILSPYYHKSKLNIYVDRVHTYKTIATLLRQICKFNNINFNSKIKYLNSSYETNYYITME
jgi:hypothetical protein